MTEHEANRYIVGTFADFKIPAHFVVPVLQQGCQPVFLALAAGGSTAGQVEASLQLLQSAAFWTLGLPAERYRGS